MKPCTVRKCVYISIWTLNCRAFDTSGAGKILLKGQCFCFWHYAALGLDQLRVKDFRGYSGSEYNELIVRAQ